MPSPPITTPATRENSQRPQIVDPAARASCGGPRDDSATWTPVHRQDGVFGGIDGHPLHVARPGMRARYVRVVAAQRTCLHLDTVEVVRFDG